LGPTICLYNAKLGLNIRSLTSDPRPNNLLFLTYTQDDVIFGFHEKVRLAVREIDRKYHPEVLFLVTTCLQEIVGEDFDASIEEIKSEVKARLLVIHTDNFTCEDAAPGIENAFLSLSELMQPQSGLTLDTGAAVGRFTFEMTTRCDFVVGIDTSHAFIRVARRLMRERVLDVSLKDEGLLCKEVTLRLPEAWRSEKVEFVVANTLALPFREKTFALFASLNLVDKVPSPIRHLQEMNRVTRDSSAQFLFSDPFSWSTDVAPVEEWLGGKEEGRYAGKGLANIAALLSDSRGELAPVWRVNETGEVWWKIRTHSNHYELIRSRYVQACR